MSEVTFIENLDMPQFNRFCLLLTYLDAKPACIISPPAKFYRKITFFRKRFIINTETYSPGEDGVYTINDSIREPFERFLTSSGFYWSTVEDEKEALEPHRKKPVKVRTVQYHVANSEKQLSRLLHAKTDREMGEALGYPESAIVAYDQKKNLGANETKILRHHYTRDTIPTHYLFLEFVPVFQEGELIEEHDKIARERETLIRTYAPAFHDSYLNTELTFLFG